MTALYSEKHTEIQGHIFWILLFSDYLPVLCLTASNITAVTIADESFPFGFNSTQFDLFLDISVLQENLAVITVKVVDTGLQTVILKKLNQVSSTEHWTLLHYRQEEFVCALQ